MTRHRRRFTPLQKAKDIALCQSEGRTILEVPSAFGFTQQALAAG
jgi:transposase-like protein